MFGGGRFARRRARYIHTITAQKYWMPLAGVRVRVRPQRWLILPQGLRTVERLHILAKLTGISYSKFRLLRKHVIFVFAEKRRNNILFCLRRKLNVQQHSVAASCNFAKALLHTFR